MDNEYLKRIYGLLESGATLGTGAVSGLVGMPYGLYKGVTSGAYGTPQAPRIAAREAQQFMERNTYQPRTAEGQANLQQLAGLLEASKLPPVMPEASLLAAIPKQAYAAQAERAGMAAEKAISPAVTRTMERGGLPAQLLGDLSQGSIRPMDVWHGSPHGPFTKFDTAKVGSGEGGSMYGVGTNLAESPSFAQGYRELLSGDEAFVTVDGAKDASDIAKMIGSAYKGDAEKAVQALESKIPLLEKKVNSASKEELLPGLSDFDMADMELQAQLRKVDEAKNYIGKEVKLEKPGYLYKVDLPDDAIARMVNLDKPMSEQPKNVKEYFGKVIGRDFDNDAGWSSMSGSRGLEAVRDRLNLYKGDFERELYKQNIPGAQYINDSTGMGQGSSNFVVYPGGEDLLTIKSINDKPIGGLLGQPKAAFDVSRKDASDIFGAGAERIMYKDPQSGGAMEVLAKPDGTASVLSLEVPETSRGKGIGQSLQAQVMQDFPEMMGQVSSKAAAKTAYRLGRRPPFNPDATLDDVYKMMDEDSSVNLVSPEMQKRFKQSLLD